MKKSITSAFFAMMAFIAVHAQKTPALQNTKYPLAIYKRIHDPSRQNKMISVLVKGDVQSIAEEVRNMGGIYKYTAGDIACVKIPVNKINALAQKQFVERIEGSDAKIELLNDQLVLNNNVYLVQEGVDMPQGLDGTGVCVGIIDEGIDFTHKDLHDAQGHSRIKWLWDQRLPSNPTYTPMPYGYGQNFTNTQIDNLEAGAADWDWEYSHGTHVTGIAAGNGLALNNYHGVAPKADIVFVAVNTGSTDDDFLNSVVDAFHYVFNKADSLHEPCAINISLGTYFGSHDGMDLQAQAIGNFISAKNGRFVAAAAGNEGAAPIHVQATVTPDSEFTWLGGYPLGGNPVPQSLYFELWADSTDMTNVEWLIAVDDTAPSYSYRGGTSFRSTASNLGNLYIDTVFNSGANPIGVVETYAYYYAGKYSMQCAIYPDSANYTWRFMTRGTGKFDSWSYDFDPAAGLPSPAVFPLITKYTGPDLNQSICSSFQCSPQVVTVGSYANRNNYSDINENQEWDTMPINGGNKINVGSLSSFSSHGPTRDGRIKPDITATGEWVLSCASQYDLAGIIPCCPNFVAAGGLHRRGSGTSMAAPCVAGTAALYFQKYPNASYQEVKDAIMGCVKTDQFTSSAGPLPNNYWGNGKLDSYKAINGCSSVGIVEVAPLNVYFENYPNPFSEQTTIHYDFSYMDKHAGTAFINISDAVGRNVRDIAITGVDGNVVLNRDELGSGVYFYSLILDGKIIRTNKLVVM